MKPTSPVVFVVDDDEAVRSGLGALLSADHLPFRGFSSAQEFLAACTPADFGCLLLDVNMPGLGGLELQDQLHQHGIRLPVIILTGHGDVPTAVRALKAGAYDFIEKPFDGPKLIERVRQAMRHDQQLRAADCRREELEQRLSSLTQREQEVMHGLIAGKANKRIAYDLGISERTIEQHRCNIMRKAGVHSIAELVQMHAQLHREQA